MNTPKYPHVVVQLVGEDGNAFGIMGRVNAALRRGGVPKEEADAVRDSMLRADNYDHLLQIVMATVTVE